MPAELFDLIEGKRRGLEAHSEATIWFKPEDDGIRPLVIDGTEDQCYLASSLIRRICPSGPDNIEIHCNMPVDVLHHAESCGVLAECKAEFGNLTVWGLTGKVEDVKQAARAIREAHREMYAQGAQFPTPDGGTPTRLEAKAMPREKMAKRRRMAKNDERPQGNAEETQDNAEETQYKRDLSYLNMTLKRIMELYKRPRDGPLRNQVQAALKHFDIQQIDEEQLALGYAESLAKPKETVVQLILEVEELLIPG